jgi:hypothetical protein
LIHWWLYATNKSGLAGAVRKELRIEANCFDQVRAFAQVDAEKNPNWRRDVLQQLELVRSDSEWQAYLHHWYVAHRKVCQVTFDKTVGMRMSRNTGNLGPEEIAITEK